MELNIITSAAQILQKHSKIIEKSLLISFKPTSSVPAT